ncbi:MAG TPA: CNNM domain-containing protein, partial [Microcella sp.]|nr:CNNM domain-containing protein [Microcella sp.]
MTETVILLLVGIVVILVIIAANGYFVAQEFAYMSVDRNRLNALAADGDKAAARALKVTKRTSFMLSGAQLGITVTGLLVGYVAEPLVGESLGVLLGGVGVPAGISVAVGTVGVLVVATVVQMIFGELFPKNLAIAIPEPMSRFLARSTNFYLAAFGWLISIFDAAANAFLRLLRIEPVHDLDSSASADDLEHIIEDSRESGD